MSNGDTHIPYDDTVDFIVRRSDYIETQILQDPRIIATRNVNDRFIMAFTKREDFQNVIDSLGISYISSSPYILGLTSVQTLNASGIIQVHRQPYLDLKGRGVLIGFVDTGIDYTLDTFIYEDGTSKIQCILDFTIPREAPENELYFQGSIYENNQINEALRSEDPFSIVPSRDTDGHGTFLASVAAGRSSGEFVGGAAPDAEIIAVKLRKARTYYLERNAVPSWQENAYESTSVMLGIEFVLEKARELNRPVVICVGLGTNIGLHDGFSIFEEYLWTISNLPGVCVCVAAGNESQARHHTQGTIENSGDDVNIDIRAGENAGDVIVAISNSAADRLSVSIVSPTGEIITRIPARNSLAITSSLILENSLVSIEYYFPLDGSGSQLTLVRITNITPGIWTIKLYGDIILDGVYHAWLPMTGFVSPNVEFLTAMPYYTITIPGTAFGSICCGAYNSAFDSLYINTSWGPSRNNTTKPDFVAPGVDVDGFYPAGYGTMNGTSIACSITCGACALMMQWGIVNGNDQTLSTYQIRAYLIRGCSRIESVTYPNEKWGYGALNLLQSFTYLREV